MTMTAPPREPQNLYDALSTIYDWLCDDRLTQWPYMENGPFYSDLPKYQEVARAALAAAPAPSAEPPAQAATDDLVQRLNDTGEDLLAAQGALVRILNAIAGADIPINLSPESQELVHACVQARRVLAASGEAIVKGGSNVL